MLLNIFRVARVHNDLSRRGIDVNVITPHDNGYLIIGNQGANNGNDRVYGYYEQSVKANRRRLLPSNG